MTIGVLAVQGAFAEHIKRLKELGIDFVELRKKDDLDKPFDGIILPGGESTVQGKLLKELDMYDTLKNMIKNEVPVLALSLIHIWSEPFLKPTPYFSSFKPTVYVRFS